MTALERDPERRWQSAAAMRTALINATTELQATVSNDQLAQWVEWAFSQAPPGEESELSQLIKILEVPSRPSGRVPASFDRGTAAKQPSQPVKVVPRPTAPAPPARGWLVALFVLVLLGGGAYAAYYFGVWDRVLQRL